MTYITYEFTAFSEASLLALGNNGSSLGCGDTFAMPATADTCISVSDNDAFLSGDSWCNENANDGHGQHASLMLNGSEAGNGGQIYAEQYHWVYDQHGNWYILIEIEQEGSSDDYYSFYNGSGYSTPAEGTELTVHSSCNVTSDWIDYKCLDAGEKAPVESPWVFDEATCTYTIQAEDFDLDGFNVVHGSQAAGGELVKIAKNDAELSADFGGTTGIYNLTVSVQDETDGVSKLKVYVNGEYQDMIKLDRQSDGGGSNNGGFSDFTLQGLEIAEGDHVEIRAWKDGGEFVRIDELKFEQVKFVECDDPDAVKLDFEGFNAGDVLTNQIDGVLITATGGSGDAMIFDSQNPTGGDADLETQVAQLGNVLIVSEDGDSSDPDDVVGGSITFDFLNPSEIFDIKVIDTEEGGTITLTLEDGSTQTVDIPEIVNGGVAQVMIETADVVRMEVSLNGSGAIDDLCYVPGENNQPDIPVALEDSGMGCADDEIIIDLSDNIEQGIGMITGIDGVELLDGQTKLISGVNITRDGDTFIFDGEDAYAFLDIGQTDTQTFSFGVTNAQGGFAEANINLTFCGDANSYDSLLATFPTTGTYQVENGLNGGAFIDEGFAIRVDGTGDTRLDGQVFENAYCLSFLDPAASAEIFADAPVNLGDLLSAEGSAATGVFNATQVSAVNGQTAADNLDLVSYIVAQNFEGSGTYTGWEVQFAIWELTDNVDATVFDAVVGTALDAANVDIIVADAIANGEGFAFGDSGQVGAIIDPNPSIATNSQPFIIGFDFDSYDCLC